MRSPPEAPPRRPGRLRPLRRLLVALLLAGGAGCSEPSAPDPPGLEGGRPNLLLITVDTLRADRLGAYGWGSARTPHIDALAREGTLFESAYTPLPRTSPALASLFSSLPPHAHGLLEVGERLPDDVPVLAERLASEGYATAGISANAAASRLQGLDRGFTHFLDIGALARRNRLRAPGRPPRPGQVQRAEAVTGEALAWLGRRGPEEPWFLWLLYMEPHFRYDPPPEQVGGRETYRHWFYEAIPGFRPKHATIRFDLGGHASSARADLSDFYDGELAVVDASLGRLLEGIRRRGDDSRTLVVFTSDHGESLGEHGYFFEHGAYTYDVTMRVPWILRWPGRVPAGRRIEAPVSLLDVAPTALSLMGLGAEPPGGAARDLAPQVRGAPGERGRVLFGESGSALLPQTPRRVVGGRRTTGANPGEGAFTYVREGPWLAVRKGTGDVALYDVERDPALDEDLAAREPARRDALARRLEEADPLAGRWRMATDGRFKLIRVPTWDGPEYELYDLEADPAETRDRAARRPEVVERLRPALEAWTREALSQARPPGARTPAQEAETLERLRALGYVE